MGPGIEVQTFEGVSMLGRPRYLFRIVDCGNNEVLATSQRYKTKLQRDRTAVRLSREMRCHVVEGKRR